MTAKPTPDALDHFISEVRKAHTLDDVLERQKMLDELADDIHEEMGTRVVMGDTRYMVRVKDFIRSWKPQGE